jgi:hypothetical protein
VKPTLNTILADAMKIGLLFLLTVISAAAQTNAIHTWTLKSGVTYTGDYFTSGAQAVVIKVHGTNFLLKISDLTTNDWLYFQDCKSTQRQKQLDVEAAQLRGAGYMEMNGDLIAHFPEKVDGQTGWIDCEFCALDDYGVDVKSDELGIMITKNGGDYVDGKYVAFKTDSDGNPNPVIGQITALKRRDKIRMIGNCIVQDQDAVFIIHRVEMIQTAAEAAAIEAVRE